MALWSQQQPSTMPGDNVDDAALLSAPALAPEDEAVDSGLEAVLEVREGIEVEVDQALAVSVAHGAWEEISEETLLMPWVWVRAARAKESEWSQLVAVPGRAVRRKCSSIVANLYSPSAEDVFGEDGLRMRDDSAQCRRISVPQSGRSSDGRNDFGAVKCQYGAQYEQHG